MHMINVVAELACGHCGNEERLNKLVDNATLTDAQRSKYNFLKSMREQKKVAESTTSFSATFFPPYLIKTHLVNVEILT